LTALKVFFEAVFSLKVMHHKNRGADFALFVLLPQHPGNHDTKNAKTYAPTVPGRSVRNWRWPFALHWSLSRAFPKLSRWPLPLVFLFRKVSEALVCPTPAPPLREISELGCFRLPDAATTYRGVGGASS
jgi:hypothetical protein